MTSKTRLITDPPTRVLTAARELERLGYLMLSRKGNVSRYYGKIGCPYKIRVSTHVDPLRNDDVKAEVVVDYDTIEADINVRAQQAARDYERAKVRRVTR